MYIEKNWMYACPCNCFFVSNRLGISCRHHVSFTPKCFSVHLLHDYCGITKFRDINTDVPLLFRILHLMVPHCASNVRVLPNPVSSDWGSRPPSCCVFDGCVSFVPLRLEAFLILGCSQRWYFVRLEACCFVEGA